MKTLAGRLVPIHFVAMMLSIFNMIIVPIVAGLFANRILYGGARWTKRPWALIAISAGCFALAFAAARPGPGSGARYQDSGADWSWDSS